MLSSFVCLTWGAHAQLVASFKTITQGDSCGSRAVQFDASGSSSSVTSFSWVFLNLDNGSDMETGSGKLVAKNFLTPGNFQITLKISDGAQVASSSSIVKVYQSPVVDFIATPSEGCSPLKVLFRDKSTPGDGRIVRWEWNYNDGRKDIVTTSDSVSTVYPVSGVYTPTLIVTNSAGCTKSLNKSNYINVYPQITPTYTIKNNLSCQIPATVLFENTSPAGPFNYTWDFGDGTIESSNATSLSHAYNQFGAFVIKLTATNTPGTCSGTAVGSGLTNVYMGKPTANFTLPAFICSGNTVVLTPDPDASKVTNAGRWFFEDDGSIIDNLSASHSFQSPGSWRVRFVAYNSYSGCASDTIAKTIEVLASPQANFRINNPNGCSIPYVVSLTNTSAAASNYEWSFGDASPVLNTADLSAVTKTYTSFSTFVISLKATSVNGCISQKDASVNNAELALNFDFTPKEGCMPLAVLVQSSIPVGTFTYDFGNGNVVTSTSPIANETYPIAGTYGIKMKIKTAEGCEAESPSKTVTVNQYCDTNGDTLGDGGIKTGQIYVVRARGCDKKYAFTFQDTLRTARMLSWDFDGYVVNTSADSIAYTFPKNGKKKFLVTSRLQDFATGAIIEHKIRVLIVDEKANFTMDKTIICKEVAINFKTLGIDSSHIASYTWDYGDGSSREVIDNLAVYRSSGNYSRGDVAHAYKEYGVFRVKLIIKDIFGCKDSLLLPTSITVRSPVANMKVSQNRFCSGQFEVTFSNDADSTLSSTLKEWKWDFGDGSTAVFQQDSVVTHPYLNTSYFKTYQASLTIIDSSGCSDKQDTTIYSYAPVADFTSVDTLRCGKFDIPFVNTSQAIVTDSSNYVWTYGNGEISRGFNGRQAYSDTGKYTISLIIKDDGGCMDTVTKDNFIKLVRPQASFTIGGDTSKCIGTFSLPFMSTSTYATEYIWDFGDSSLSRTDKSEVSHFYREPGAYNVRLQIIGLDGCKDSTNKLIRIKGSSEEMIIKDYYLCYGDTFTAVVNGKNIKTYYWDFGDLSSTGDLTTSDSVTHIYKSPGIFRPNVILVSPEGCQTTVTVTEPVLVDSIYAGPSANIECGDQLTTLNGGAKLNLSGKYVWTAPDSTALFLPDSLSLVVKVNQTGRYILRSKDNQCPMTDTVMVTTSGIVPTAIAGVDKKLDCISGTVRLAGSTTTASTQFSWKGPAGTIWAPFDTVPQPEVSQSGRYILTVTQKECTKTDTVYIADCSLLPTDTLIQICASKQGIPGQFSDYNLLTLEEKVRGGKPSIVTWFYDSRFDSAVVSPTTYQATNEDSLFAKITSMDSTEVGRAEVSFLVDTLPVAPTVYSLDPICQGFDRRLQVSGSTKSTYEWLLTSDSTFKMENSTKSSILLKAGSKNIVGKVIETDSKGCKGDTGNFELPVDLLPSKASVNGRPTDTITYCITNTGKQMLGDTPVIGYGRWEVLKNTGQAKIDSVESSSLIADFTEMSDTLVAQWVIKNGVCPENVAVLTIFPERAFYPSVSLSQVSTVCEGTPVTYLATSGEAGGDQPKYAFYDSNWKLVRAIDTSRAFSFIAIRDTAIQVKIFSNYRCLYHDTANSKISPLDVINKAVSHIFYSADTLCVENGPVTLSAQKNYLSEVTYEWYYQGKLFDKDSLTKTFSYKLPSSSGTYGLKVYNSICPPAYDTLNLKIYEKPVIRFSQEVVEIMYTYGAAVPLPLKIDSLLFPKDISMINWNPTDYLGTRTGTPLLWKELDPSKEIVQQPFYLAQEREITTVYWVAVRTGPEGKGCESNSSVQVNNYIPIKIPNAFSPNGDGLNETWILDGVTKYPRARVIVFNRWGTIVFEDQVGYRVPWDGTMRGEKLVAGTYYYVIEFSGSTDGSDHSENGSITIVY